MAEAQKAPGDGSCPSKPSFGSTVAQRKNLSKDAIYFVWAEKFDGYAVLSKKDENNVRHFILPMSGKPLPFGDDLMQQLREECAGLEGTLHFELYCKQNANTHHFYALAGMANLLPKNYLSALDFHARGLTLVFLNSSVGENAIERIQRGEKHFAKGVVRTSSEGSKIWPYEHFRRKENPIVTVSPSEVCRAEHMEVELARVRVNFQRPESPRVEGVVCHLVYAKHDVRNRHRVWGSELDKGYLYRNPYVFKVKHQGHINFIITGIFKDKLDEDERKAVSKTPKKSVDKSVDELVSRPPPKPAQYHAMVTYTDCAGIEQNMHSIPMNKEMATDIKCALTHQFKVHGSGMGIRWYYNLHKPEDDKIRFIWVYKFDYDVFNPVFVRPSDKSSPFKYETPLTRRQAMLPQEEKDKHKAVLCVQRAKRQEKLEDSDQWNHKEHRKYTFLEMATKKESTQKLLKVMDPLCDIFKLTDAQDKAAESYRPPKQPTAKEEAAIESEKRFVCDCINHHRYTHNHVSEQYRASMIARAAAVGVIVAVDIMWPVVELKSFVHDAWRSTSRNLAQATALEDEQRAVTSLIRTVVFRCEYYSEDARQAMISRAADCGIIVDTDMWPKLSQVNARKMLKTLYLKYKKDLPVLSDELAAKWKPRPAPGRLPLQKVDKLDKGKGRPEPDSSKRGRPPAHARVGALPAVVVDDCGEAAPKRCRPPTQGRATPTVMEISSDDNVVEPVDAPVAALISETAKLQKEAQQAADKSHANMVALLYTTGAVVVPFPGYNSV